MAALGWSARLTEHQIAWSPAAPPAALRVILAMPRPATRTSVPRGYAGCSLSRVPIVAGGRGRPARKGRTITNSDQKAAIRELMASTGENYTTAKREIELALLPWKAQSEQLDSTLAEQRTRTLNERFDTVAEQLGSDKSPAVRLAAGVCDGGPG